MRKLLCKLAVFLPSLVLAAPYLFPVPADDLSANYLLTVLGPVSDIAVSSPVGPNAASVLLTAFGSCLISASLLLGGFIGFKSVFVGAGSGNILGENVSSVHAPAKIVGGLAFLMPDSSGYAPIQHFVIWVVMNGVGFANQLWLQVVANYEMGNTLLANSTSSYQQDSFIEYVTKDLFYVALARIIAEDDSNFTKGPVVVDAVVDPVGYTGSGKPGYVCAYQDLLVDKCNDNYLIQFPVQDPKDKKTYDLTAAQLATILNNYVDQLVQDPVLRYALTNSLNYANVSGSSRFIEAGSGAATELNPAVFFGNSACYTIVMNYEQNIVTELLNYVSVPDADGINIDTMKNEGWMGAAYYYWVLSESNDSGYQAVTDLLQGLSVNANGTGFPGSLLKFTTDTYTFKNSVPYKMPISNYVDRIFEAKNTQGTSAYSSTINAASTSGLNDLMGVSAANLLLASLMPKNGGPEDFYALDYDFSKDRLRMFIASNASIVNGVLTFIQVCAVLGLFLALGMVWMRGLYPTFQLVCAIFFAVVGLIIPFMTMILGTAAMGSIYVAAIPGLIFASGALAWFCKVLEVVVAAPIVSMAAMIPDRDDTAKIQHALMQLLVVTMKPALMILGFAIAAKSVQLTIMFVGGAYNALGSHLSSVGATSSLIFFIMMYELTTLTTISFISRAFGIITSLPEQVFMLIGVSARDDDSESVLQQFEDAAQQGATSFNQLMSNLGGVMNALQKIGKIGSDYRNPKKNK